MDMKYKIYSVYDNVADKFGKPFYCESDKLAIREFNIGTSSLNAIIKKDYILVRIGEFDEQTGVIFPLEPANYVVLLGNKTKVDEDADSDDEEIVNKGYVQHFDND